MAFLSLSSRAWCAFAFSAYFVTPVHAVEKSTSKEFGAKDSSVPKEGDVRLILDKRLRFTSVDKSDFDEPLVLWASSVQLGLETVITDSLSVLLEVEHIQPWDNDFTTSNSYRKKYPGLATVEATELNQLTLTYRVDPTTEITIGRQSLALADQRFIGNRDWSLNEQTFDAVRFVDFSLGDLNLDFSYINHTHRPFGDEAAEPDWTGDTVALILTHPTPIGNVSSFAYLIDIDEVDGVLSSQTYGGRLSGGTNVFGLMFSYDTSYARQSAYGSSNLNYRAHYIAANGQVEKKGVFAGLGYESLGADGAQSFQTPMATQKRFQGWSHQFALTPIEGLQNLSVKSGYIIKKLGPLKKAKLIANYHDYSSEVGGIDFGSEFNLAAGAKWQTLNFKIKYANYQAERFAKDSQKAWLQVGLEF